MIRRTNLFIAFIFVLSHCTSNNNFEVMLDDLVTICSNWDAETTLNVKEYAAVLKISGDNLMSKEYYFVNNSFTVNILTEVEKTGKIKLKKSKTIDQIDGVETLKLFLSCDLIQNHFPAKQQKFGDDCYLVELTNMLATGKFYYKDDEDFIEIMKSPKFTFHIGPRMSEMK